jgi:tetratricopeptide (TPR) repeat protein
LDYFVEGMHDVLIGNVGKISALRVLGQTTANAYKDTDKSLTEIAKELGINTFIEGSVLCIKDSICLQVRMISAEEEKQLWVHDFKVERSQIQNLYGIVTKDFSNEIDVILTPKEEKRIIDSRLVDPAAHDLYMKGLVYNDQMSMDGLQRAAQYFKLANEQDPDWAPPYRGMASVLERQYQMGFVERSFALPKISEYIDKAIELDPNDSWVYNLRGSKYGWFEWDWERGEQDFLKSIELNPNHSGNHAFYAALLTHLRRIDEALPHAKKAQELDPLNPFILGICAGIHIQAGECQTAIDLIEKAISIEPNHYFTYPIMINAAICIQDYQKAFEVMKQLSYAQWEKYEQTENFERILNEQGWIAVQENITKFYEEKGLINDLREERKQASRYIEVGEYDKAMDYLEKAFEAHSPNLPSISDITIYNKMKDNKRYIDLLKRMNLPVD